MSASYSKGRTMTDLIVLPSTKAALPALSPPPASGRRSGFSNSLWPISAPRTRDAPITGGTRIPRAARASACRATGIATYLKNGGTLYEAAATAKHASTRTTQSSTIDDAVR